MKSRILGLFALVIIAVTVISCSLDHRPTEGTGITGPTEDNDAEWTILYYGAGNYAGDILSDGQSQAVAIVQGLQGVYTTERVHAIALISTAEDNGICRLYDICFRPGEDGNQISSTSRSWGHQDMSSPQLLKQFVDSALLLYPAQHYALIIGGEGEAWRGACRDDANGGQIMPIPAMYQSLDATTGHDGSPMHFDLLLWLTPGMSTLEVAYEMRNKVDYMVATSSLLPQPGFLASRQWLLDLAADPSMSAERLGRFVVARMYEKALAENDTLATFNLLDMHAMSELAQDFSMMADSIRTMLPGHSAQILQIWQSLWDLNTGDSSAIDLSAFIEVVLTSEIFSADDGVRQMSEQTRTSLDQVLIERRSTRQGDLRKGLTVYSPMMITIEDLQDYNALQISAEEPGWTNLLAAMQESGSALVTIRGTVTWAGHMLENLYAFLNIAQVGAPVISLTAPVSLTQIITPDNAEFDGTLALDGDSVTAYIGIFQDLDNDQQLSVGDRYGYYHQNPSPPRDWMVIHSGDEISGLQIDLSRTY